jgi:hypothetical protein
LETWDEALSGCAQRQVHNADLEVLVSGGVVKHSIIVDDVNGVDIVTTGDRFVSEIAC